MSTDLHKLVSTNQHTMVESKDEHEEGLIDEYILRFYASPAAHWLFSERLSILTRKKPPQEDTGEYGEFPRG